MLDLKYTCMGWVVNNSYDFVFVSRPGETIRKTLFEKNKLDAVSIEDTSSIILQRKLGQNIRK